MNTETKKLLVVGGCSFTFEPWNWPKFVVEHFNGPHLLNTAMACQGNGLIAKKIIANIDKTLKEKKYKTDDILVGIMWSGIDRYDFHIDHNYYVKNTDGWLENPTKITQDSRCSWMITNAGWKNNISKVWYENLHTSIGAAVYTCQNILMTQWYLEKHNIKYFMTTYMNIFYSNYSRELFNDSEVKYLFDMIDFDKFLPVIGCHEWIKEHYPDDLGPMDSNGQMGIHPNMHGHQMFSNEVIIPYIKEKNLL